MALDRSTQPIVKDASGVLVGVAQVRVGQPSIRSAQTAVNAIKLIAVGKSDRKMGTSDNTVAIVKPTSAYLANTLATPALTGVTAGQYIGKVDGAFIFRATASDNVLAAEDAIVTLPGSGQTAATAIQVYSPYGIKVHSEADLTLTTQALTMDGTVASGLTVSVDFTGAKVGDTWVLPVWGKEALSLTQTGIVSPFSMFYDATDSIGGLKSASFQPKIDGIKKLESGFPSYVADQIIDKVSVDVSWNGLEYTNSKLTLLKQMISRVVNTGELSAISVELVMRTRGNQLVRMWIPSCTFTSLPTYAPTNDYSDVAFAMSALKQTEFSTVPASLDALSAASLKIYNGWLSDSNIYSELSY
jgi:hypothetical protein